MGFENEFRVMFQTMSMIDYPVRSRKNGPMIDENSFSLKLSKKHPLESSKISGVINNTSLIEVDFTFMTDD